MRVSPASICLALLLGAAAACYRDDYLLGALCVRDTDCGADQCCAGRRCRPDPEECYREQGDNDPFVAAYMFCDSDDLCLEHGIPRCLHLPGASQGFCADYCVGDPNIDCEKHVFGAPTLTLPRTCVALAGQSLCALDCSRTATCPDAMRCHAGICVPAAPP